MKFICDKRAFSSALNITMRAVPSKTTLPILECVCVSAEDGLIRITSNDMEFAINTVTSAIVNEQGSICIDAKILNDIIRKLPDGDVTLETSDNSEVKIKCGKNAECQRWDDVLHRTAHFQRSRPENNLLCISE